MKPITLTLPYPLSANRYWRPVKLGTHISIVPTKEAKQFRTEIGWLVKKAGITTPMPGRVQIDVRLYPNRPQDWQKRQRLHGAIWDDTVMCIDLDNANKVLLDALKGVAIEDDKWVRRIVAERMEPDEKGARVVLTITPLGVAQPQAGLFGEAA
ncbi:RusA family crossover junction endodeoxyribonuclease [Herbaspirillum rubrisubalbicans]|uniref:RusA family crossover junction endodeoxyribonuclease n=1 Tax=Herbaspirillum rubrisubalbicans TaxID=80842 RepID=A0AAD0U5D8_9BURK|nr:RusA family crossover junction endodeoxyribonuclease [Herbaspirillum rubrisubalbicans]AYR23013.1 RusA family crossover junction endodeoxyribonuclease [Herbaspirillum rubrisubalbicans]